MQWMYSSHQRLCAWMGILTRIGKHFGRGFCCICLPLALQRSPEECKVALNIFNSFKFANMEDKDEFAEVLVQFDACCLPKKNGTYERRV